MVFVWKNIIYLVGGLYFSEFCVIMNMSRELEYNKKGNIQFWYVECPPKNLGRHLSHRLKCHFFIVITKKVKRNKMMAMSFRTLIIKVLVFMHQASSLS